MIFRLVTPCSSVAVRRRFGEKYHPFREEETRKKEAAYLMSSCFAYSYTMNIRRSPKRQCTPTQLQSIRGDERVIVNKCT
jgi:hypothetical protein